MTQIDVGILGAALIGYQRQLEQVKEKINEIRSQLRGRAPMLLAEMSEAPPSRISPAGRARIAAAQRKRWAAAKKASKAA